MAENKFSAFLRFLTRKRPRTPVRKPVKQVNLDKFMSDGADVEIIRKPRPPKKPED